jgi:hypothetical protein
MHIQARQNSQTSGFLCVPVSAAVERILLTRVTPETQLKRPDTDPERISTVAISRVASLISARNYARTSATGS